MYTIRPKKGLKKIAGTFTLFVASLIVISFIGIRRHKNLVKKENLRETNAIDEQDVFRAVDRNIHVHSAYWDNHQIPNVVRILGISSFILNEMKTHTCHLDYGNYTVNAPFKKHLLHEGTFYPYGAVYFDCETVIDLRPQSVALRKKCAIGVSCDNEFRVIWKAVQPLAPAEDFQAELAVCVRPFFGPFDDISLLAEFIATKHFLFLDDHSTPDVKQFIKTLQTDNLTQFTIEMRDWNIPDHILTWQNGQMNSVSYCVYHMMSKYKYVAIVDLDEHLVPRKAGHTLIRLIKDFDRDWIGTFVFYNLFFCENVTSPRRLPRILTRTIRNTLINFSFRPKVIIKPAAILDQHIHLTIKWLPGFKSSVLDLDAGSLNHYRGDFCSHDKNDLVIDTYASKHFGNQVLNSHVFKIFNSNFGFRPIKRAALHDYEKGWNN